MRVQLAEDEPNIVESLTFVLERAGFEVSAQSDGVAALTAALAAPPDLVILDVMLPAARRLRHPARPARRPARDGGPAGDDADGAGPERRPRAAERRGASLFMTKPFSNAEVLAAVRELAGGVKRR